jgi:hypothetical protein
MIPSPAIVSKGATVTTGAATCAASLPHDGNNFWFCSGFEITSTGATAAGVVGATLSGLLGGTQTYVFGAPAGATLAATPLIVEFPSALPSVDVNTDIVLTLPNQAAGVTLASVVLHGYKGAKQLNA